MKPKCGFLIVCVRETGGRREREQEREEEGAERESKQLETQGSRWPTAGRTARS